MFARQQRQLQEPRKRIFGDHSESPHFLFMAWVRAYAALPEDNLAGGFLAYSIFPDHLQMAYLREGSARQPCSWNWWSALQPMCWPLCWVRSERKMHPSKRRGWVFFWNSRTYTNVSKAPNARTFCSNTWNFSSFPLSYDIWFAAERFVLKANYGGFLIFTGFSGCIGKMCYWMTKTIWVAHAPLVAGL